MIVVMMENHADYQVLQSMPYAKYLLKTYAGATKYFALCHPSVPNYLGETSGKSRQCGSDNYHAYTGNNIGDVLQAKGLTWKAYLQGMPKPCDTSQLSGLYTSHHNPMVYYADVAHNATRCRTHDVNAAQFATDFSLGHLPSLSLYSPNMANDCHNTALSFCNTWLRGFIGGLVNASLSLEKSEMSHTAIFVAFDESQSNDTSGYNHLNGGHVYLVAISPWSKGRTDTSKASPYNLLSTIEWLLGTRSTGGNDGTSAYPAMTSLF